MGSKYLTDLQSLERPETTAVVYVMLFTVVQRFHFIGISFKDIRLI